MQAVNFERINQLKNENFEPKKFQQENFKMTEGGTLAMQARYVLQTISNIKTEKTT